MGLPYSQDRNHINERQAQTNWFPRHHHLYRQFNILPFRVDCRRNIIRMGFSKCHSTYRHRNSWYDHVLVCWGVRRQRTTDAHPFKEYTAFARFLGIWTLGIILWSPIYYLLLWVLSGFHTLMTVSIGPHSLHSSLRCRYPCHIPLRRSQVYSWQRVRATVWIGWGITTIACGLFTLLSPETSAGERVWYFIIMGVGCGILFPGLLMCAQVSQQDEDVCIATNTFTFLRSLGQTFGVAIGGLIFQNQRIWRI